MLLELIPNTNNLLHNKTDKFDFKNPQCDIKELVENMKETMIKHRGLGLSANQCGINLSVFVFGNPDDPDSIIPFINPQIVYFSDKLVKMVEGCLSYPKIVLPIKRSDKIRVRYSDINGNVDTLLFEGISARIIQHEYDHLNGIVFVQKANRYHIEKAQRQKIKIDRLNNKNINKVG